MEAAVDELGKRLRRDPLFGPKGSDALPCPRERLVEFLTYIFAGSPCYDGGPVWERYAGQPGFEARYRRFVDHLVAALVEPSGSVCLALEIRDVMERVGDHVARHSEQVEA